VSVDDSAEKRSSSSRAAAAAAAAGTTAGSPEPISATNTTKTESIEEVSTSTTSEDDTDTTNVGGLPSALTATTASAAATTTTTTTKATAPSGLDDSLPAPQDYKITSWYPHMKHLTAPTSFVEASKAEIQALVFASDSATAAQANQGDLRTLEAKLDRAIEEQGGVAFIKIETRSPKDVLQSSSMMDRLRGLVRPTMKTGHVPLSERVTVANADTIAFVKGIRQLFKIKTGAEALAMLKMSDRVKNDLNKALGVGDGSALICVRMWRDVDAAHEFRAFVHEKKLTACSQYCYYQCFPELQAKHAELATRIQQYFDDQVLPALPYSDAVLDFHVGADSIEIIELSPFQVSTGACMFSWKDAQEKSVLENGPFQLRILEQPKSNPYECLPNKWRTWFEQERGFNLRNNAGAGAGASSSSSSKAGGGSSNNNNNSSAPPLPAGNPPAAGKQEKEKKKWTFGKKAGKKSPRGKK